MSSLNLNIQTLEGNLQLVENISIINYYPNAANTDIPQCLPESVHKSFLEGVQTKNNQPNAACAMFRRSLEISLKIVDPDSKARNLAERIEILSKNNQITPSLKEWAHKIRLDGNDAIHEIPDSSLFDAEQMYLFTKYVLIYLFTLPEQIKIARTND